VLWNLLAAFALWGPRQEAEPIAPAPSWLSGVGHILLAFSAAFASVDWILSLEPMFWSSIFPMIAGYPPVMPDFAGQLGEDDLVKLIAYIKSLARWEAGQWRRSRPISRPAM
jgi:hypothetical protein